MDLLKGRRTGSGSFQLIGDSRREEGAAAGAAGAQLQLRGEAARAAGAPGHSNRGPVAALTGSDTTARPWAGPVGRAPRPPPVEQRPRRAPSARAPGQRPPGPSRPRRSGSRPRPAPRRVHLRGAPVAEFVGDGLDAPGPGHRDVAALRAHIQPHHRHDWLAVRLLRPESGSGSPAAPPAAARGSRGSDCFPVTGRPASPGPRRLAEGSPEAGAPSLRGRSGSCSGWIRSCWLRAARPRTDPKGEASAPRLYVSH